jgi:AcrR family transcriptional regulator
LGYDGQKIARSFYSCFAMKAANHPTDQPATVRSHRAAPGQPKGQQTKASIVRAALALAEQLGLEGLSIGAVAERMAMSKSGVFAHFGSREELQLSVVAEYERLFTQEVFEPALALPRGLPRMHAMFDNWVKRVAQEIESGCLFISGAVEFDDRPGPVREALVRAVQAWLAALARAVQQATQAGHLSAQGQEEQMVFEIHGLILALHFEARFLNKPGALMRARQGFEHVLQRYSCQALSASPQSNPV